MTVSAPSTYSYSDSAFFEAQLMYFIFFENKIIFANVFY